MKFSLPDLFDDYFEGDQIFDDFAFGDLRGDVTERRIDGKPVFVAGDRLKPFLSFINHSVCQNLKIAESVVYSYRKDKNIGDAVRAHSRGRFFYQTDVANFFVSIDSTLIKSAILRSIDSLPFENGEAYVDRITQLVTVDNKLPPGFSTSPSLSNAALYALDEAFLSYCEHRNVTYTRYSDDVILSAQDQQILVNAAKTLTLFFRDLYGTSFGFNPTKTKYSRVGRKVKLLGLNILPNGLVTVDTKLRNKVETLIHNYSSNTLQFLSLTNDNPEKSLQILSGHLNFIKSVDEKYFRKLEKKYGTLTIDTILSSQKNMLRHAKRSD